MTSLWTSGSRGTVRCRVREGGSLNHQRRFRCLLAALMLVPLALGCGAKEPPKTIADVRGGINEIVSDPVRAARMQAILDEIESTLIQADSLVGAERTALTAMVRDHGSTREAIERSLAELNALRESIAGRYLSSHAAFKAEATAEEWKKLRELEMSVIESAVNIEPTGTGE